MTIHQFLEGEKCTIDEDGSTLEVELCLGSTVIDFEVRALKLDNDVAIEFQRLSGDGLVFSRIFRDCIRAVESQHPKILCEEQKPVALEDEIRNASLSTDVIATEGLDTVVANLKTTNLQAQKFTQELVAILLRKLRTMPEQTLSQLSDQKLILLLVSVLDTECCAVMATLFSQIVEQGNLSLLMQYGLVDAGYNAFKSTNNQLVQNCLISGLVIACRRVIECNDVSATDMVSVYSKLCSLGTESEYARSHLNSALYDLRTTLSTRYPHLALH